MRLTRATQVRIAKTLAAALAGGTLMGTCQTRFKESVVQGTRDYLLYTLLDPTTLVGLLIDDTTGTDGD
jgi:hypothetical protein